MREKARIHRILSLLEMIWQQQPDVRFNQLIANLQKFYSRQNNDYGKRKVTERGNSGEVESSYLDFFYLEDTEWEFFLKSLVESKEADKKAAWNLGTALEEYSAGQYMTFDEVFNENELADKSVESKDKYTNDIEDNAVTVVKFILAGKTVEEIAKATGLSPKYIEKVKMGLLEGTNLKQLMKQYESYEKEHEKERNLGDAATLDSHFGTAISHEECTHFYIEENDEERLSVVNLNNNKIYELYYDIDEDDYYVINEKGERCYSVDAIIKVKMLKRVD